ncbi:MAG TPA: zinc transporter ZupT [Candidatus Latescibacteria bacterium]|nr:zinc transporter ZupT [Candidatus Latescibacterota bacterium]HQK22068.1 zinc transporter ZupT [Candidatus Latescibacterota bacterium]
MNNVLLAFGLTVFAGMATGIGSIIAFTASKTNYRFLSVATGFSAGVMLYVAFVEIFLKGTNALVEAYGGYWGHWANAAAFFGGMLLIGIIDNVIPSAENPHTSPSEDETAPLQERPVTVSSRRSNAGSHTDHKKLLRMGLFTAFAITIHNFPEGLATFLAALNDPGLGIAIAVAVALHNIPEGVSVSVPIYYATGDRKKAFMYSLLSGVAEPVGAAAGYVAILLLVSDGGAIPPHIMGILFGGVAGIMVYISVDELLPTSRAYGKGHDSLLGMVGGMLVMALSLLLMK